MLDPDALVSGPDAATHLPVSAITIRSWAHRGWIDFIRDEHGRIVHDEHGKPKRERRRLEPVDYAGERGAARYRWSDLLDAECATRRNPKSPGRGRVLLAA